jgi:hypothetical protein
LFELLGTLLNFFELAVTYVLSKALLWTSMDFYELGGTVGEKNFFEAIVGDLNIY